MGMLIGVVGNALDSVSGDLVLLPTWEQWLKNKELYYCQSQTWGLKEISFPKYLQF